MASQASAQERARARLAFSRASRLRSRSSTRRTTRRAGPTTTGWCTRTREARGRPARSDNPALKFVVGIGLAIGWVIFLNAARRSLGAVGIVLVAALCAGLVWLLVSWEVISASSVRGLTHITLAVLAIVLAVGLCWSHVSRRRDRAGRCGQSSTEAAGRRALTTE